MRIASRDRIMVALLRRIPTRLLKHLLFLLHREYESCAKAGFEIRGVGYYEPSPDLRSLKRTGIDEVRLPVSVDIDVLSQLTLARELISEFAEEAASTTNERFRGFDLNNGYFAGLDAMVYYGLLRRLKPKLVVEVGCGYSTQLAHFAIEKNRDEGNEGELIAVEPYPEERLLAAKLPINLVQRPLQEIEVEFFTKLKSGDVLFIDSSHVAKFRSDVNRIVLEILPVLEVGVWVHFHDVFIPYDYPEHWIFDRRLAFNEQYLLEAFLSFNRQFEVRLANQLVARAIPSVWQGYHSGTDKSAAAPASFWIERVG